MALKQIAAGALTASDASAKEEVGTLRTEANGKVYRYIRNCGSRTYPKGAALAFILASGNTYKVWGSRQSGRSSYAGSVNAPAGILVGSVAKGYYGWAQIRGNFLGTSLRASGAAFVAGCRVGLCSGINTTKCKILSTSSLIKHRVAIGVSLAAGSSTFMKGIHLYGRI